MKKKLLTAIFVSSLCGSMQAQDAPHGYPYSPVPFTSVKMTDSFWGQRLKASREVTIPLASVNVKRAADMRTLSKRLIQAKITR